jgi:DNA primase
MKDGTFCSSNFNPRKPDGYFIHLYFHAQGTSIFGGSLVSAWIDFKALRAALDFEQVLRHYKVEVKRKGDQHLGFCPLPNHNGNRNSPSFSANLKRGIFQCFGCGTKGNLIEFAAHMEKVSPDDGPAFRALAAELQKRFCPQLGDTISKRANPEPKPVKKEPETELPRIINAPLDFDLKGLDSKHPYLLNRGFSQETIDHFGLGFCTRGYHKDRVAIPLHDHQARLVGYAGRVVDDSKINEGNPRYRFPGDRERDGKVYEFRKTLFLYNGYRIKGPLDRLFVVESFTATWWLDQNDLPDVVGIMGADCADEQAKLIVSLVKPDGQVWAMTDGDPAGERCAASILTRVAQYRLTRWVKLDEGKQPTDLSEQELKLNLLP